MKKFLSILAFVNLIFANFTFANTDNNETCGCGEGLKSQEEINKFFGLKSKNSAENPGKNSNTKKP